MKVKLRDRGKEYGRKGRGRQGRVGNELTTTRQAVAGEGRGLAGGRLRRGDCVVRQGRRNSLQKSSDKEEELILFHFIE